MGKIDTVTVPPHCLQHRGGRCLGWGGMKRSTRCSSRRAACNWQGESRGRDCAGSLLAGRGAV